MTVPFGYLDQYLEVYFVVDFKYVAAVAEFDKSALLNAIAFSPFVSPIYQLLGLSNVTLVNLLQPLNT